MKTPESLHTKILDAARDEVAKEHGFESYAQYQVNSVCDSFEEITQFESKAALLAMEKQAEFYKWASSHKWRHDDPFLDGGYWYKNSGGYRGKRFAELELYEIFTTRQ